MFPQIIYYHNDHTTKDGVPRYGSLDVDFIKKELEVTDCVWRPSKIELSLYSRLV